jgi:hypothetical protein
MPSLPSAHVKKLPLSLLLSSTTDPIVRQAEALRETPHAAARVEHSDVIHNIELERVPLLLRNLASEKAPTSDNKSSPKPTPLLRQAEQPYHR